MRVSRWPADHPLPPCGRNRFILNGQACNCFILKELVRKRFIRNSLRLNLKAGRVTVSF
jgi:hypothetical protein